ncbi:uncharacterized protein E5676_scaffold142G003040 [Cucumis melo var. makuwa]|uniref:Gag-pro-like protein n=1 Tax=Cucumis melo var. makuwa TaxID=1194695 RepID=A0A5D3DI40_CUCMM|nr:uncharacterized protein E5676_scaffold142G003040 [Cucumis melo var. makuwa]
MDEQTNDQAQVIHQDVEGLKDQLAKILELLTTGRGKEFCRDFITSESRFELDVVIPLKFKTLDFEKYNGTTCPKSHLVMYCRKMSAYAYDDKLLIIASKTI